MPMLCILLAAGTVAVLPVEPRSGALSQADAAALTETIRSVAREALAPHGVEVIEDPAQAQYVVRGRAAQMEGAAVVGVGIYAAGTDTPIKLVRVVGIGLPQLQADARAKVPGLLTSALGLAPASSEAAPRPGTLRMPQAQGTKPAPPPSPTPLPAPIPTPAPPQPPPANEDPLVTTIREVTAEVEKLRGLKRKQNLKVQILDDKLFSAAVREKARKELTPAVVAAERARWLAFDLAPPAADPGQILLEVLDEQVAGFYDPFGKQLFVRREPPASAAAMGPDGFRLVLAHEIEHALQDQNFGIPEMSKLPDDDARLARSALLEGDAMAVMTAYGALRGGRPVKASILAGAAALRAVDTQTLLRMSGKSPGLANAPAILREELVAPYAAGFALVAEAYKRGGFALVDKMFLHPPVSSHQVLHPEAYFAGELPAPLAPPPAPPGSRTVSSGRMGELGTRVALEVCADRTVVRDFAPRWAGDAYAIVEDAGHKLSLLWTIAWSGNTAANVANVMRLLLPCWEDQANAAKSIAPQAKVDSAGDLVAVARGSVNLDAALARQLAVKVAPPQPVPPLGEVAPVPEVAAARVEDGHFTSARLALRGDLPQGYDQDPGNPLAEVAIRRPGYGGGGASLAFLPEALAGEALEAFFRTASSQVAAAQGGRLSFFGRAQRKLAGANAEERVFQIEGKDLSVRIDVAPYCGGKGALTLLRIEGSPNAREALDRFADSIASTGAAPACAELE